MNLNYPSIHTDMLQGFEIETQPLTEYERNALLPVIVNALKLKLGKDKAVKNSEIVTGMKAWGYKITEARVRKIINHIRTNGLVSGLMATSNGYYIATHRTELKEYIESLRGRELAIRTVRQNMEKQMIQLFGV